MFKNMKIREQLLIPVLGMVIFCIAVLQAFTYNESATILEEEITRSITRDQEAAVRAVDDWFTSMRGTLVDWSNSKDFLLTLEGNKNARATV